MNPKHIVKTFMESHEPDTFVKDHNGRYMYYSESKSSGINIESFFIDLVEEVLSLTNTPQTEMPKPKPTPPIKPGDTVIVDATYAFGGYEAKVISISKLFARIECDGDQWDLMRNRITKIEKS